MLMNVRTLGLRIATVVIGLSLSLQATFAGVEEQKREAQELVEKAVALIQEKGEEGLKQISTKDGGFYFKEKSLYAFVYSDQCVMLAHPYKPTLIGKSYKGKPDVRGKKFRDEIVNTALTKGEGWTDYSYTKPGEKGIHEKTAFGKLVESGGKKYIVVVGVYK